jgi:gamma-glutamyltranspeptidase/glutathione hydrolase
VLSRGGNAVDAAVAVAAALAVTEPCSTGVGGDALLLYYDSKTRKVSALLGCGRAPAALTLERVRGAGLEIITPDSPLSVTVPGAPALWCDAVDSFGSGLLSLESLLKPAIELAEFGFPVAPLTAIQWKTGESLLKNSRAGSELLFDGYRAPQAGEVFRNAGLARTLRLLAERGKAGFYEGPVADAIVSSLSSVPMTRDELRGHRTEQTEPIYADYRGIRIYEIPPPTQGLSTLIALKILDSIDTQTLREPGHEAALLDVMIRAMRVGFLVADTYVADRSHDPDSCRCCGALGCQPICALLSEASVKRWQHLFRETRTQASSRSTAAPRFVGKDTVQFCVVDEKGNACSFINSTCMGFGSGIVPEGFGFSLQNRGLGFSLNPAHPNALGPCRRPYHTLMPGMSVFSASGLFHSAFGVMGGMMQPQGHLQVITHMIDGGMDPQAALDAPRFCIESRSFRPERIAQAGLLLESGISSPTVNALTQLGHHVLKHDVRGTERMVFGRGQIILHNRTTGTWWGGSDPRADGCAIAQL